MATVCTASCRSLDQIAARVFGRKSQKHFSTWELILLRKTDRCWASSDHADEEPNRVSGLVDSLMHASEHLHVTSWHDD